VNLNTQRHIRTPGFFNLIAGRTLAPRARRWGYTSWRELDEDQRSFRSLASGESALLRGRRAFSRARPGTEPMAIVSCCCALEVGQAL
jgi:hypothetical protein